MQKADVLGSSLSSRDHLAGALVAEARLQTSPMERRRLLEQALEAYESIALRPETPWHYSLEYPPGCFADQVQEDLRLRAEFKELGANSQLELTYSRLRGAFGPPLTTSPIRVPLSGLKPNH